MYPYKAQLTHVMRLSVNSLFHTMTSHNLGVGNNSCQCLEKNSTIDGDGD